MSSPACRHGARTFSAADHISQRTLLLDVKHNPRKCSCPASLVLQFLLTLALSMLLMLLPPLLLLLGTLAVMSVGYGVGRRVHRIHNVAM